MSVEKDIEQRIYRKQKGELFFPEDFSDLGTSEAVRISLHRLEKEGLIRRVAHGIYVRPKISSLMGELTPTAEEIARGIAKRDRIRLVPTGTHALHALGLTTQMPMKLVFLTDGSPREINVGKRTIKLKKTTPKNLSAKGKISSLVIQALREIGQDHLTQNEEIKIVQILKSEMRQILQYDIKLAPVWIQKIMRKALV
jgi:ribosomal protein S19E (S16A)